MANNIGAQVKIEVHLNPFCIDVTVQDYPLVLVSLVVSHVSERHTDDTFLPLPGCRVKVPIQLISCHGLCIRLRIAQQVFTKIIVHLFSAFERKQVKL